MAPTYVEFAVPLKREGAGSLFGVAYEPSTSPRGVLVVHHGYGEHSGRYQTVFNRLASEPYNLAVVSYDAFSFGKSTTFADHRGHVDEFDFLVDDMQEVLKVAKTRYPNKPVILCGHSLGALIATRTVLRDQSAVAALVLSSAAMDVVRNLALKILGPISGVAAWLLPMARIAPAVDPKDLSVDKQVVADYLADPLVFSGPVRAKFAHITKGAIEETMAHYKELTLPILAIHGDKDNIAPLPAVQRLLDEAASPDKQLVTLPGAFHELVHGPEKEEVTQLVGQFALRFCTK